VKLPAAAVPEAGYFWFFDANNVDLTVRVLDARFINGKFWVFAAALTNVEYTLQVVDTQTDVTRTYPNPPGHLTIVVDTNAFSDDGSSKAGSRPLGLYDDPAAVASRAVFLPKEALPSCDDPEVACVQGGRSPSTPTTRRSPPAPLRPPRRSSWRPRRARSSTSSVTATAPWSEPGSSTGGRLTAGSGSSFRRTRRCAGSPSR
jgi:hypothetical protein